MKDFHLVVSCPDRVGLVAEVTGFLARHQGSIIEAQQFTDSESGQFFMRYSVLGEALPFNEVSFCDAFRPIAERFSMNWRIFWTTEPKKVVLMVSKLAHCLSDLLYRWRSGELNFDIPCVISNHEDFRGYVEWHDIPYVHIPIDPANKERGFAAVKEKLAEVGADSVVLARYMQILPEDLCNLYPGKIINIHHSFLPSFAGAKPYHQAAERGVKLIGATCHYVTSALDAGPIIEQDVVRVDHNNSVKDMVRMGRDVEKAVLARGLRYHLEDRVIVHGNKTVVFS